MLDQRPQGCRSVLDSATAPDKIEIAGLAGGHVERSVTTHLDFLQSPRRKRHVLTAAARIRGAAVIMSYAVGVNRYDACTETTSRAVPMLDRKLLDLGPQFGLAALLFHLLCVALLFLLDVILHLAQFRMLREISGQLIELGARLIVVVTLSGRCNVRQLLGKDLLLDLGSSGIAQRFSLPSPKQRTALGRIDILGSRQRLLSIVVRLGIARTRLFRWCSFGNFGWSRRCTSRQRSIPCLRCSC